MEKIAFPWYNQFENLRGELMFSNKYHETSGVTTISQIKKLGKNKDIKSYKTLLSLFNKDLPVFLKREIVSSIGRHKNDDDILDFIKSNVYSDISMDIIYQMYRTLLYKSYDERFYNLRRDVQKFYNNEVINKMDLYYDFKKKPNEDLIPNNIITYTDKPKLLEGDNAKTIKLIPKNSIQLIFTSPPYYNAREYSIYKSYTNYLKTMKKTFRECYRVLEYGRYIAINASPIISYRPGREFDSTRYPIPFDFHKILIDLGFEFKDEIIWIKPEPSVPYRIGGYMKSKTPLRYKPKSITESILIYKKKAPFLTDINLKRYKEIDNGNTNKINIEKSNCWYIAPSRNKLHSATFPKKLCENIINYYSFTGDIVLDPFAGSGTLGIVALEMGRIPVLCEINKDYIKIIKEKIGM